MPSDFIPKAERERLRVEGPEPPDPNKYPNPLSRVGDYAQSIARPTFMSSTDLQSQKRELDALPPASPSLSIEQAQNTFPADLSFTELVTDAREFTNELSKSVIDQLKSAGMISPTSGVTNFKLDDQREALVDDQETWYEMLGDWLSNSKPTAFDNQNLDDPNNYHTARFNFIAARESFRSLSYDDGLGNITIGYGFNMSDDTAYPQFLRALGTSRKGSVEDAARYNRLLTGAEKLSEPDARKLFEVSIGEAEKIVRNRLSGVMLKGHQRLALVSMVYNHPSLLGPELIKHVKKGDLKAIENEIKHRSNKHKIKGIDNRRVVEWDMYFGVKPEDDGMFAFLTGSVAKAEALLR